MFILAVFALNPLIWNLNLIHISARRLLTAGMEGPHFEYFIVFKVSTATTLLLLYTVTGMCFNINFVCFLYRT